jgi:hypothetical protein
VSAVPAPTRRGGLGRRSAAADARFPRSTGNGGTEIGLLKPRNGNLGDGSVKGGHGRHANYDATRKELMAQAVRLNSVSTCWA